MAASITQGANVPGYTYDTEHSRIKLTAPEGTTLYFSDLNDDARQPDFRDRRVACSCMLAQKMSEN